MLTQYTRIIKRTRIQRTIFGQTKDIITQYVQPAYTILNVGAGNSRK